MVSFLTISKRIKTMINKKFKFSYLVGFSLVLAILYFLLYVARNNKQPAFVRVIWVTRFEYASAKEVEQIISNLSNAGFSDIFFQVRGYGTVYFESEREPWAVELFQGEAGSMGKDPGWDPLAVAVSSAKKNNVRLHAYINTLTGWKGGASLPPESDQLWNRHRDWFMKDRYGVTMQAPVGWYSFLNPALLEVRAHLRGIIGELCRYDLAGINLDYIRYPYDYYLVADDIYPDASQEELRIRSDFSYDETTLQFLRKRYGIAPTKKNIDCFRRNSITATVSNFSDLAHTVNGASFKLSACMIGNPYDGYKYAYQDSSHWLKKGYVNWVVYMNYATNRFEDNLENIKHLLGVRLYRQAVIMGIYGFHSIDAVEQQIDVAKKSGCLGVAIFSYSSLYDENHRLTAKGRLIVSKIKAF